MLVLPFVYVSLLIINSANIFCKLVQWPIPILLLYAYQLSSLLGDENYMYMPTSYNLYVVTCISFYFFLNWLGLNMQSAFKSVKSITFMDSYCLIFAGHSCCPTLSHPTSVGKPGRTLIWNDACFFFCIRSSNVELEILACFFYLSPNMCFEFLLDLSPILDRMAALWDINLYAWVELQLSFWQISVCTQFLVQLRIWSSLCF